jgi:hypothetical protein
MGKLGIPELLIVVFVIAPLAYVGVLGFNKLVRWLKR